jgi:hypothetical protein
MDPNPSITLGISIEPLSAIEAQVSTLQSPTTPTMAVGKPLPPLTIVAQRIAKNLFNYMGSFASQNLPPGVVTLGQLRPDTTYVSLKAFEDWWSKFNHKVESDPGFLERESD